MGGGPGAQSMKEWGWVMRFTDTDQMIFPSTVNPTNAKPTLQHKKKRDNAVGPRFGDSPTRCDWHE